MSDDIRMIKVSEREVDIIFLALDLLARSAGDNRGTTVGEVHELADDIREQFFRHDDGWGWPERDEPTDLNESLAGQTFSVPEDDFIKAGSRAATRRQQRSELERPFADSDSRTARLFRGTINVPLGNDPIDW